MKHFLQIINGCLTIFPLGMICANICPGLAQSIIPTRNATNTLVTPVGNKYNINGGMLSGDRTNLFHSFDKFGLSTGETANFISSPGIRNILGRVTGGNPSLINGLIQVTGGNSNLFLINPAGIVFGSNARLNVPASFTATTATGMGFSNNQWFNAIGDNNYHNLIGTPSQFAFDLAKSGNIINAGKLTVPVGANLTLLGGNVINTGQLTAPTGNITINAVPNQNIVKISQPGHILSLEITPPRDTTGQILPIAPVDLPTLLTGTANNIETGLSVNSTGNVQLNQSGTILPNVPGLAIATGNISVAGITANAGGGNVNIFGDKVGVFNSNIDASGVAGGGTVKIGGDFQGGGTLPHATQTIVAADTNINANATATGNGGKVIVWSDNFTSDYGNINARGGVKSGDGGLVEVSGKDLLIFTGGVNAGATVGKPGTLLLDPKNITITNVSSPLATILNPNPVNLGGFGISVASNNSNLLIGAPANTSGGVTTAGQAYLFNTSGGLLQTFNNPNPVKNSFFGNSVAISGSNLLIGALANTSGGVTTAGQAYLFNTSGGLLQTFNNPNPVKNGYFGNSVAILGSNLLIGAPANTSGGVTTAGQAYLFNTSGGLLQTFNNPNPVKNGFFGSSVALSNSNLLIGANGNTSKGVPTAGQAYLFNTSGGLLQTFNNPNPVLLGYFGTSVAISGSNLLIGAIGNTSGGISGAGQAYLFNSSGGLLQTFNNPNPVKNGYFGTSVAMSGSNLLIGAIGNTSGGVSTAGQAFLFNTNGNLLQTLNSPNPQTANAINFGSSVIPNLGNFGSSVAFVNSNILVGSALEKSGGVANAGNSYLMAAAYPGALSFSDNPSASVNVDPSDITRVTNTGTNVVLQANNDITVAQSVISSAIGKGGAITLQAGRSILVNANITTDNGNLTLVANETTANGVQSQYRDSGLGNITVASGVTLNSGTGDTTIRINTGTTTDSGGNISLQNITAKNLLVENLGASNSNIILNTALTPTGNITLTANGDVTTQSIKTPNNISITSNLGQITTKNIDSSSTTGIGGNLLIKAIGDVQISSINTSGGTTGGNVDITTGKYLRVNNSLTTANCGTVSICTIGNTQGGSILLRHGGDGIIPFIVGDATQNGTASAIYKGNSPEQKITSGSFLVTQLQDNGRLGIITNAALNSVDLTTSQSTIGAVNSLPLSPNTTSQDLSTDKSMSKEFTQYFGLPDVPAISNSKIQKSLLNVENDTGIKPAVIYVFFVPSSITPVPNNQQLNISENTLKNQNFDLLRATIPDDQDHLELILIAQGYKPIRKSLNATRTEVLATAKNFQATVASKINVAEYMVPAQQMYQWLVAPLENDLQKLKIQNLVYIMDRDLRTLPLAAMYDGKGFIIERYSVGLMPSIALTDTSYKNLNNAQLLAMGSANFSESFHLDSLPAAAEEINLANQIWGGKSFLNDQFTLENLKSQREHNPFRIVHLATHADFNPGLAKDSYIYFAQERLPLPNLRSIKWNNPPVELLILSACRTAIGDEDAELGFAGLAVQTGVKSALASLWYISDEGTLGLMTEFYEQLKTAPIKAEALRRAQLAMMRGEVRLEGGKLVTNQQSFPLPPAIANLHHQLRHPYYWSGFTIIGNPW